MLKHLHKILIVVLIFIQITLHTQTDLQQTAIQYLL
jgi:hypothetical protein